MKEIEIEENLKIGLDEEWYVKSDKKLYLIKEMDFFKIMPLLEKNTIQIIETINKIDKENGKKFPINSLITSAINGGSDYWANLALVLLKDLNLPIDHNLQQCLLNLTKVKWASQKSRQLAKSLIHKRK